MIKFAGTISGAIRFPYIYFIIKDKYIYIGETQKIPVIRWCDHLSTGGSFSKNLRAKDVEAFESVSHTQFFAFQCDAIFEFARQEERKRVTQYVEHLLHIDLICNAVIGNKFTIVSDTSRTAPMSCNYTWVNNLSKTILDSLIEVLKRSDVL